jgi:hypothetical protein
MRKVSEDEQADYQEQERIERWEEKERRRLQDQRIREWDPSERSDNE